MDLDVFVTDGVAQRPWLVNEWHGATNLQDETATELTLTEIYAFLMADENIFSRHYFLSSEVLQKVNYGPCDQV